MPAPYQCPECGQLGLPSIKRNSCTRCANRFLFPELEVDQLGLNMDDEVEDALGALEQIRGHVIQLQTGKAQLEQECRDIKAHTDELNDQLLAVRADIDAATKERTKQEKLCGQIRANLEGIRNLTYSHLEEKELVDAVSETPPEEPG